MQYQIQGQPYPVVILTMEQEETVCCQKGAMAWMTPNMEMQTKGGGIGKMFSKSSAFFPIYNISMTKG